MKIFLSLWILNCDQFWSNWSWIMSLRIQPHLLRRSSISVDRLVTSKHDFNLKSRSREVVRFCYLQRLVTLPSCQKLAEILERINWNKETGVQKRKANTWVYLCKKLESGFLLSKLTIDSISSFHLLRWRQKTPFSFSFTLSGLRWFQVWYNIVHKIYTYVLSYVQICTS